MWLYKQGWPAVTKSLWEFLFCIFYSSHTRSLTQESGAEQVNIYAHGAPMQSLGLDRPQGNTHIYQAAETRPRWGNALTLGEQKAGSVQQWEVKGPQITGHWKIISSCHSFAILLVQCFGHKFTYMCTCTTHIRKPPINSHFWFQSKPKQGWFCCNIQSIACRQ